MSRRIRLCYVFFAVFALPIAAHAQAIGSDCSNVSPGLTKLSTGGDRIIACLKASETDSRLVWKSMISGFGNYDSQGLFITYTAYADGLVVANIRADQTCRTTSLALTVNNKVVTITNAQDSFVAGVPSNTNATLAYPIKLGDVYQFDLSSRTMDGTLCSSPENYGSVGFMPM